MFGIKALKEKVESCENENDYLRQMIKEICPHKHWDYQKKVINYFTGLNYYFKVCELCKTKMDITKEEYYQVLSNQKIKEGKALIAEGKEMLEGTK